MATSTSAKTRKKNPMKKKGKANSIDEHVGMRLRQKRSLLNLSQEKLAESLGITFQQVQKYENGANRISASRLYQLSKTLSVPVSFFFDSYEGPVSYKKGLAGGMAEGKQAGLKGQEDLMQRKETLELVRVYYSLKDPKLRKDLLKLVKSMAENLKAQDRKA